MYDASTQTLHTTYTFTNDKILVPVVDFSRNKLIVPATELYENVTDKARDAALRACDLVSQNVAMGTAYADEKFQVLNLLQKALDMSREDMEARVGGLIKFVCPGCGRGAIQLSSSEGGVQQLHPRTRRRAADRSEQSRRGEQAASRAGGGAVAEQGCLLFVHPGSLSVFGGRSHF